MNTKGVIDYSKVIMPKTRYEIFDYSILVPLSILITVGFYDDIYSVDFDNFDLIFIYCIASAKPEKLINIEIICNLKMLPISKMIGRN